MRIDSHEQAAEAYETAAAEFEVAAAHLKATAKHFREGDITRGCAHAWSAHGNVVTGTKLLDELAEAHTAKSQI
jgi:hypothetical protein